MKKYLKYKIRAVILVCGYGSLLLLSLFLLFTHARYESEVSLHAKIDSAHYIINPGSFNFNLEPDKIIPSREPYVYTFYIANYNDSEQSEVDMEYDISIKTTTNMPLEYELYRNENYTDNGAVNILGDKEIVTDEDGAWYNYYNVSDKFNFSYRNRQIDTYYLVVYFDEVYKNNIVYSDYMDSIRVFIEAKQVI